MRIRFGSLVAISILVLSALSLTACEKDRPVPTPTRSAAAATAAAATAAPQANATQLALPTVSGGAAVTGTQGSAARSADAGTPEPEASATEATQTAGDGESFTYTVVRGDSLSILAKRFGVTQASILTLNGLTNPNGLQAGQKLQIPGQGTSTAGTSTSGGATTYTVQAGDTLSKIAVKFGVTTKQLIAANDITNPDVLSLGKVLKIPTGDAASAGTDTSTGSTGTGTTSGTSGAKTYVVKSGDTMAKIAVKNGVTLKQLMAANNITNPDHIEVGQTLKIP